MKLCIILYHYPSTDFNSSFILFWLYGKKRGHPSSAGSVTVSATDEDVITDLMEQHDQFVGSMQSRLAKLQVTNSITDAKWLSNDVI